MTFMYTICVPSVPVKRMHTSGGIRRGLRQNPRDRKNFRALSKNSTERPFYAAFLTC